MGIYIIYTQIGETWGYNVSSVLFPLYPHSIVGHIPMIFFNLSWLDSSLKISPS